MQAVRHAADLPLVGDDSERGQAIQRRLDRLGISDREFHERTGIDRKTLRRAVSGAANVRSSTYAAIESELDKIERRVSPPKLSREGGETEPGLVTFKLSGNFGVDVVVQGPVENLNELEASVERLLRGMRPPEA